MIESQFPSLKDIVDCLKNHYSIEVKSITPLSDGADMNAATYKAQTHDKSYFVKLKRDHENTTILDLLHSAGVQNIILPIHSMHIENYSLTIFPFIEGVNGFTKRLTDDQWIMLGKTLRQIHDIEVPSSVPINRETFSPKWRQIVRSLPTEPHDNLSSDFLNFMKERQSVIQRLIHRAEQLSHTIKNQKLVLCHSDIHGGNVLLTHNNIYIVDWDEPIMAPKERDLMFIGGGVANVWNEPQEEILFYKGYGSTDIDIPLLTYYRHERIVQDIAEFGQALLFPTSHNKAEMYQHFVSMFDPNGVIDIAFKTDSRLTDV